MKKKDCFQNNPFGDHNEIEIEVKKKYQRLTKYLSQFNPVKLITQLTLTYLFYPGGEFKPDYNLIHKWSLWIEFISGYLLSQNIFPEDDKFIVDGQICDKIEKLIDDYFMSVDKYFMSKGFNNNNQIEESLLLHIKLYTKNVRGETFPSKLLEHALTLYLSHDDFFIKQYGFTIRDAINITNEIKNEYEKRINENRAKFKELSKQITEKQIREDPELLKYKDRLEVSNFCKLFFGLSDQLLSFTLEELTQFSNQKEKTCDAFLIRLSQSFGYRHALYQDTFNDPIQAPLDFNTLNERPIVEYQKKYFVPNPSLFPGVLLNTFHYDLLADPSYQVKYDNARGRWVEIRTAEAFSRVFNSRDVILNPKYPDGNEMTDVLVLHDRKIFIIQCKFKGLRFESKVGQDIKSLKEDIEKGIKLSFEQGLKAKEYLLSSNFPKLRTSIREISIDTSQVNAIFLVCVTRGFYQNLVTRIANINKSLKLFEDNDYPWALSLADLEVLTEIIDKPSEFIHYALNRIKLEKTEYSMEADEVDLLNFYLDQGLDFERAEFTEYNGVNLAGYSSEVDQYFYEKYQLKKDVPKPKRKFSKDFENLIAAIDSHDFAYKTDCIDRLLLLDTHRQKLLTENIEKVKNQAKLKQKFLAFHMHIQEKKLGIAFLAMKATKSLDKLYQQTFTYSMIKKYNLKCKDWVGLAWDIESKKVVDLAVFISQEWFEDKEMEKMANQYLSKGKKYI